MLVYSHEAIPPEIFKSIFLAGPTPRKDSVISWRPTAIHFLHTLKFPGVILSPEFRHGKFQEKIDYEEQIKWEEKALQHATCILFWIPRNMETMPALTTNDEWGTWKNSGKCVLGCPEDAVSVIYQIRFAWQNEIPFSTSLLETCRNAIELIDY